MNNNTNYGKGRDDKSGYQYPDPEDSRLGGRPVVPDWSTIAARYLRKTGRLPSPGSERRLLDEAMQEQAAAAAAAAQAAQSNIQAEVPAHGGPSQLPAENHEGMNPDAVAIIYTLLIPKRHFRP